MAVDDLRPDINAFGGADAIPGTHTPPMHTPVLDALAASSLVLMKNYVQQAVCSPTRQSLLTGRRPDRTRVYDLYSNFRQACRQTTDACTRIYTRANNHERTHARTHTFVRARLVTSSPTQLRHFCHARRSPPTTRPCRSSSCRMATRRRAWERSSIRATRRAPASSVGVAGSSSHNVNLSSNRFAYKSPENAGRSIESLELCTYNCARTR